MRGLESFRLGHCDHPAHARLCCAKADVSPMGGVTPLLRGGHCPVVEEHPAQLSFFAECPAQFLDCEEGNENAERDQAAGQQFISAFRPQFGQSSEPAFSFQQSPDGVFQHGERPDEQTEHC